jgi:hypothetical protein
MDARRASENDRAKTMLEDPQPRAAVRSAEREIMADTATPVREPHSSDPQEAEDAPSTAGAALDLLLTEAGLGTRQRFLPGRETVRLVTRLARRPGRVVRRSSALTEELAKVVAGRSELKPPRGDRRSLDPAWSASWIYRRLLQAYLAVDETVDGVIDDAELDWTDDRTQGEPNALGDRSRVAGARRPADSAFGSSRRLSAPEVNVETPSLAAARGRRACRTAHGPV